MQIESVCGEPNGNRRSHAEACMVSSVTSQNSVCGYHLSIISLGGCILTVTVLFPLGLVAKLGISIFFFISICIPGCWCGPETIESVNGADVSQVTIKSTSLCL